MVHCIEGKEASNEKTLEHRLTHFGREVWWECRELGGDWHKLAGMGGAGKALVGENLPFSELGLGEHTIGGRLFNREYDPLPRAPYK